LTVVVAIALVAGAVRASISTDRTQSDHIARIDISGVISDDEDLLELIGDATASQSAKALVVSISSPGGTTYGGERIYKALLEAGKSKPWLPM
jgi:protease-4